MVWFEGLEMEWLSGGRVHDDETEMGYADGD